MALDEEALSSLLRAELPTIYTFSFRLCGNDRDAETLTQAVFSTARHKHPDVSLIKIAINEWKKLFNRPRKTTQLTESKGVDNTTRLLNTLSPDDRITLILRDVEGKTSAEAAELVGISANSFQSRLARAREMFRQAALRPAPGRR